MVYRVYVEKKPGLANEAAALLKDLREFVGITSVTGVRLINRYDVENIDKELFDYAAKTVFSEPQLDDVSFDMNFEGNVFAAEYLPGQFDQRADSAAQCIQIISAGERPLVKSAKVYILEGDLSAEDIDAIKKYVINPVESREAVLDKPETLVMDYEAPAPVPVLEGFLDLDEAGLADFVKSYGLAMDEGDIKFCQDYFKSEGRCPTLTEIRMIDTYWSDHCRHTTFLTSIDNVKIDDPVVAEAYEDYKATRAAVGRTGSVTLMDLATVAVKSLKKAGKLPLLDESEEINACTVKIKVNTQNGEEDWLLLFKNETHNHPTEIEPFGGAATCIGGAIRDPLSGRSYVYAAMRVTGAADPLRPVSETRSGKLPQRKIVTTAAAGYSSYGNQIGLATGMVDELYHPGYEAKRMEIGAVIAAAPAENVRRERPDPGDSVILLGGRTGRDGCGGATGSSKSHTVESLESCGAEVQKGNAPEERKLQRLFRNPEASKLITRCNDFGAGGVSVAIGELADGLDIDLGAVPKKYEGLDGTELAISESQERMAVVVAAKDVARFCELAATENLEATVVAKVKADPRLTMTLDGRVICDISREFLNSNGAEKHIDIEVGKSESCARTAPKGSFTDNMKALVGDLKVCSRRGLSERFDSTIGAGTVMMPFGGKNQLTPIQAMVHKIPVENGDTNTVSFMSWGFDPYLSESNPFCGAYNAVIESVAKLAAAGANLNDTYLTFQEYFEKPGRDPKRWGKPFSALLGAYKAQMELGMGSIGGKDSMSGSFEDLDVPPTLVSFAVTTGTISQALSNEFKTYGHKVVMIAPKYDENGLVDCDSFRTAADTLFRIISEGKVCAAYTPTSGGVAEAVFKMTIGNGIGFKFADKDVAFATPAAGCFVVELTDIVNIDNLIKEFADNGINVSLVGQTCKCKNITCGDETVAIDELLTIYEGKLEPVFSCNIEMPKVEIPKFTYTASSYPIPKEKFGAPKMIIPVFPGTNCEYDTAKAAERAGIETEIIVIRNLSAADIAESAEYFTKAVKNAQMIFVPGGFSGGDEPDGSGKFITAFFRNKNVTEAVTELLEQRDGLMCGVCNGFQALIKLGLVPYGKIIDTDENCPTLTYNTIGRHQSRLVRTRVASNKSPWFSSVAPGSILTVPISHGEGRFIASDELVAKLAENGQIATQYVDELGNPTNDIRFNPNNSTFAIEGITSPDGRVLGKMGHSERVGQGLYKNVEGRYESWLFASAKGYYSL